MPSVSGSAPALVFPQKDEVVDPLVPDIAADTPVVAPAAKRPGNPAKKMGLGVLVLLLGSLGWHVSSDLLAPSSSTGSVAAFTTMISPRVGGQVAEIHVADNQAVRAGDPLFSFDTAPFELTLRQAEVAYAQALLTNKVSIVSLASIEAQLAQATVGLDNAKTATARAQEMFGRGLSSQAQLDGSLTQFAAAQASHDAVAVQLAGARLQAGVGDAVPPQVQAAELQLEQARLNRQFTTVTAPSDGVITNLKLAVGQFVNAGTPALTFIESETPWVVVDMRENQLINLSVGDPASVVFDGAPGRAYAGRVRGIAWGIDPGRTAANGLPQNQALTRWFEPARAIPVHIELIEGETWPANARVGSKANALVFTQGQGNLIAGMASGLQIVSSYLSYLY